MALSPDGVKELVGKGVSVCVENGAGIESTFPDEAYTNAGAEMVANALTNADVVLKVLPPSVSEIDQLKSGAKI